MIPNHSLHSESAPIKIMYSNVISLFTTEGAKEHAVPPIRVISIRHPRIPDDPEKHLIPENSYGAI